MGGSASISEDPIAWPESDLKCLRETDKEAVRTIVQYITSSEWGVFLVKVMDCGIVVSEFVLQ